MLGDDFSRVNRDAVIRSVKKLQNEDGRFLISLEFRSMISFLIFYFIVLIV